jgi:hypothetical protein
LICRMVKNTHVYVKYMTSFPPWLTYIFLYLIVVINEWLSFSFF